MVLLLLTKCKKLNMNYYVNATSFLDDITLKISTGLWKSLGCFYFKSFSLLYCNFSRLLCWSSFPKHQWINLKKLLTFNHVALQMLCLFNWNYFVFIAMSLVFQPTCNNSIWNPQRTIYTSEHLLKKTFKRGSSLNPQRTFLKMVPIFVLWRTICS